MTGTLEVGALEKARCRATVRLAVRLRLLLSLRPLITYGWAPRSARRAEVFVKFSGRGERYAVFAPHGHATRYSIAGNAEACSALYRPRTSFGCSPPLPRPPPASGRAGSLAPQRLRRRTEPLPATPNHSQPSLSRSQYNHSRSPSISVELVAHRDVARLARDRGELRRRGPHALPRLGAHRP